MGALSELEEYVSGLNAIEKAELDTLLVNERNALWLPEPENKPQVSAYVSNADILLFGGSPGGGKTSLICGLAVTEHTRSVIFRAELDSMAGIRDELSRLTGRTVPAKGLKFGGRSIELGHLSMPGSELKWQGNPHDLIGFDEGAQLPKKKVQFVMGWLRSTKEGQKCRVVIASNPPTGGEGEWLIEWFAPWLDPTFANPAAPGELRWAASAADEEGTTVWLKDGRPIIFIGSTLEYRYATKEEAEDDSNPNVVQPKTRTFIPSFLRDNPYLAKTNYRATLQALPEPLRSQMIRGDFLAGRKDHLWQIFPSAWVRAAMERWTPQPPANAAMTAISADVAQGGPDNTVLAPRHGPWFAQLIKKPGVETPKPSDVAGLVVTHRRNGAIVVVDMGGGYGGGVAERLEENQIEVRRYLGANTSGERTKDGALAFFNKRAESHWRLREALDPDQPGGSSIALPPDPELLGDLTSVHWWLASNGIHVEEKDELAKAERLGRSPDKGDAVIMSWSEGEKALVAAQRKRDKNKPVVPPPSRGVNDGTGWLGG